MSDLIGLFDRDVFLKLACCDLWAEAVSCLGVTHPYRLPSTESERSSRNVLSKRLPAEALPPILTRLKDMVASVPLLPNDLAEMANIWPHRSRLLTVPNIASDVLLAGVFFSLPQPRVLVSGDKRFIAALRDELPSDFERCRSAIISLEGCLCTIAASLGVAHVLERVRPVASCDGSLELCVGHSGGATEDEFLLGLRSHDPCRTT